MVEAKPQVKRIRPYNNAQSLSELFKNRKKVIKLDTNETTVSPSPKVTAAILQFLQNDNLHWYPDVEAHDLTQKLSRYVDVPKNHILTFNGSDHALETVARAYLCEGDEVIHLEPTYDHFRVYAQSCGAIMVGLDDSGDTTLTQKIDAVFANHCKMVYLANPNNPTGHLWGYDEICEACENFDDILFVIDEAYFEFSNHTVTELTLDHPNVVVTRSFSKAFGLAGLRCGYLVAHPSVIEQINKIRVGKSVNALAQHAAVAALQDIGYMKRYVEEVKEAKSWLVDQLNSMLVKVVDTPANFILINANKPTKITEFLKEQNVFVRDRSQLAKLKGHIRITIGDKLTMKRFWRIFETLPTQWLNTDEVTLPDTLFHLVTQSQDDVARSVQDI